MLPNILKETVRGIQPILIEDEMLQHREVFLIEEVNRKSATDMIKQLMYLDRIDTGKPVTVYINSPGGEVVSGLAVYDYIKVMKSPVNTVCMGSAASMGAILFLAGKERSMLKNSEIMIPVFPREISVGKSHLKYRKDWISLWIPEKNWQG